jgi:hypothetical protein
MLGSRIGLQNRLFSGLGCHLIWYQSTRVSRRKLAGGDSFDFPIMLSTTPDRKLAKWESAMPALEINFALWIMIGCAAVKITHLVQYLTN